MKKFFDTPGKATASVVIIVAVLALAGAAWTTVSKNSFSGEQKKPSSVVSDTGENDSETAKITLEQAKEIALSDAKVTASDVIFTKEKLEVDDGVSVYDIEFLAGNTEYEYDIREDTGAIYSKDKETREDNKDQVSQTGQAPQEGQAADESDIGEEQAKSIAAEHAGFSVKDVRFTKAKLDRENGVRVYDIEFHKDGMEYDYEINAATGDIVKYDSEKDDDMDNAG